MQVVNTITAASALSCGRHRRQLLRQNFRLTTLGYLASDGRPLVAPVWFVVDGGELVVRIKPTKVLKVFNVAE